MIAATEKVETGPDIIDRFVLLWHLENSRARSDICVE